MRIFNSLLLTVTVLIITGCRTMMLNQNGETLNASRQESCFYAENGATVTQFGNSGPEIALGYRHRFAITDNLEFQLRTDNYTNLVFHSAFYISTYNYLDAGVKVSLYSSEKFNMAILPYAGIYGGVAWLSLFTNGILGPVTGVSLILSNEIQNQNENLKTSIYYGLSFEIKEDLLSLKDSCYSLSKGYITPLPFIDIDAGISFGYELQSKGVNRLDKTVISANRFETGITASFNTSLFYNPQKNNIEELRMNPVKFSVYFLYGFGRIY